MSAARELDSYGLLVRPSLEILKPLEAIIIVRGCLLSLPNQRDKQQDVDVCHAPDHGVSDACI